MENTEKSDASWWATWNSSVNIDQKRDALRFLAKFVPYVIEIMMDNSQVMWGSASVTLPSIDHISREFRRRNLTPVIHGAGQEEEVRGGTVAAPLIIGFGTAAHTRYQVMDS